MARKFLYIIAFLIFVVLGLLLAFRLNPAPFMRTAFVPSQPFVEQAPPPANSYANPAMWLAHPATPAQSNPALWTPAGLGDEGEAGHAAIFFVHPTSLVSKDGWNASLDDQITNDRTRIFVRGEASVFNHAGTIWAPRYRQAAVGAFMTDSEDAKKAIDAAYQDVATAFDQFLIESGNDRPIILAGHSQGSLHLTRLLKEKVAGRPIAKRIAAAYVIGWPISITHDLLRLGLPACGTAEASNCIVSWSSFAEPADPGMVLDAYGKSPGYDGTIRGDSPMLCTNPLTGAPNSTAAPEQNPGTLFPSSDLLDGKIEAGKVGARCDQRGLLMIGSPPEMGAYVLPGNNYHVYDYALFWVAARHDVARRLAAFEGKALPPAPVQRRTPDVPVAN